jgi:endonuclease/exonuclease/phosphatase family metal-dependent hydrolase
MTYNVHRCRGRGGRDSTQDIAGLCADARPDVIALQELDAPETDEAEGAHHARDIASALGMTLLFCRTFQRGVGFYGHALLSRTPLELVRVTTFPVVAGKPTEPRGAIWAKTTIEGRVLDVVSTHLGVTRRERQHQSRQLVSHEWLADPRMGEARLLCGDFNAVPGAMTYRRIARSMRDVQRVLRERPKPTFPSVLPFLRLDHVFVSEVFAVRGVTVPHDARARRASDHLPLIVDLDLT